MIQVFLPRIFSRIDIILEEKRQGIGCYYSFICG